MFVREEVEAIKKQPHAMVFKEVCRAISLGELCREVCTQEILRWLGFIELQQTDKKKASQT